MINASQAFANTIEVWKRYDVDERAQRVIDLLKKDIPEAVRQGSLGITRYVAEVDVAEFVALYLEKYEFATSVEKNDLDGAQLHISWRFLPIQGRNTTEINAFGKFQK